MGELAGGLRQSRQYRLRGRAMPSHVKMRRTSTATQWMQKACSYTTAALRFVLTSQKRKLVRSPPRLIWRGCRRWRAKIPLEQSATSTPCMRPLRAGCRGVLCHLCGWNHVASGYSGVARLELTQVSAAGLTDGKGGPVYVPPVRSHPCGVLCHRS